MADDAAVEDYPTEIEDNLNDFDSSLSSVQNMVQTLVSVSRSDRLLKLDPLEQAKLDLMSAYALNSMFWMYLVTQGVNPKDHAIKQELVSSQRHFPSHFPCFARVVRFRPKETAVTHCQREL
ncbi:nuclear nucleic acid-binding protein C1D isoform X2 [Danio aesculapii]|uniref:nuclear nucleic acid-binding protein C1D isoform X2 n=1 Tax=Danio aesculapii TaxID=1142201 RepID=UPI0024C03A12|nr:nuclear nucleic acid-binding protein C1D isoform X2 [Danio aesculapii]